MKLQSKGSEPLEPYVFVQQVAYFAADCHQAMVTMGDIVKLDVASDTPMLVYRIRVRGFNDKALECVCVAYVCTAV